MSSESSTDSPDAKKIKLLGRELTLDRRALQTPIAIATAALAVLWIGLSAGVTSDPGEVLEPTVKETAVGKELYQQITARHPALAGESRFDAGSSRRTNRMVLPEAEWEQLTKAQRISLAQYLDSLGTRWQIRVGRVSEDGRRIVDDKPLITSERWHKKTR